MRLSKRRMATRVQMNMTPMIDIVFLLIIFFMTVTQVSRVNRERLELPQQPGAEDQKPAVLTVNVDQAGAILVSGSIYQLADLIALVADELARVGDDPSRLTVVLRTDQRAVSRTTNDIMRALARLQIHQVRIAVQVPRGAQ